MSWPLTDRRETAGRLVLLGLLGLFFIVAGLAHFLNPAFYQRMMPPALPAPDFLIMASGVAEIFLGGLVLFSKWRRAAAFGIIALLVAAYPANLYIALNPELFPDIPNWAHFVRLPFQAVFIAWAAMFTKKV